MEKLVSICIPAYKNAKLLERLLNSIKVQNYKNFEVVITDDSPENDLEALCNKFNAFFELRYYKNSVSLGSPANWNKAIKHAKGDWIKIMHNDDWFSSECSLQDFIDTIRVNPDCNFVFSGFSNMADDNEQSSFVPNKRLINRLMKNPLRLFKKNYIGHPSTTLIKNANIEWFDEKIKWVVDFEFYIRCLKSMKCACVAEKLVNIGIHDNQITKDAFRNRAIEIPENFYLLDKLGLRVLKNYYVYDYYWRLSRNLSIRRYQDINDFIPNGEIPGPIRSMLGFQFKVPLSVLKIGVISKLMMSFSFIKNLLKY